MIRFLIGFFPATALAGWLYAGEFHVPDGTGWASHNLPFLNTYSGSLLPEEQWFTVDLTENGVPVDATAALIQGLMIITHGETEETCDLRIWARKPGTETSAFHVFGQVIEATNGAGQRSPLSFIIPLVDGTFEMHWERTNHGQWPEHCAYGVNLKVAGYWR